MTRSLLTLAALCGVSASAFAAAPHPTAVDTDGDGAFVATVDTNGDGKKDHADIGVRASVYDCEDGYNTVSPQLTEVVGDSIDNDCSSGTPVDHKKGDTTFPVNPAELARWKAHWPIPWSDLGFVKSYARLTAGSHVTIVTLASGEEAGTFTVEDGYQVGDWITGSLPTDREFSAVRVKPDGVLEVFTDTEVEHAKKLRGSASGGSGISTKAAEGIAAKAAEKAVKDERDRATKEREAEDAKRAEAEKSRGKEVNDAFSAMSEYVVEFETGITKRVEVVESDNEALKSASVNLGRHAALIEAYAVGNAMFGDSVSDQGKTLRNKSSFGGGLGLIYGVDGQGFRADAFLEGAYGKDGSDLAANAAGGAEYLWDLDGGAGLGVNAGYANRLSHCDDIQVSAVGRMPMVGVSVAVPFSQDGEGRHGVFLVRADAGPEWVSRVGDRTKTDTRLGGRLTVGVGGGVGALLQ